MDILREGARDLGLTLSPQHLASFSLYQRELAAWNQRLNLTAITGSEEVQRRHFLDSLTCLLAMPGEGGDAIPDEVPLQNPAAGLLCADVGTGAGFPGLPVRLLVPDMQLTLIEATAKKVAFLEHMVDALELTDVHVIQARAEDLGHTVRHRERYDVVLSRAVAPLAVLVEYCLPLCRLGGRVIAPKGGDAQAEAEVAVRALETLGGRLVAIKAVELPDVPGRRYLVVIDKVAQTPERYPRRAGMPSKHPLA